MANQGLKPRIAALKILNEVFDEHRFVSESGAVESLDPADRAFARRLAETALRHWGHLKIIKSALMDRPLGQRAAEADRLISLGLAQLLYMEIAPHAAVSTTVDLVAKSKNAKVRPLKGLTNAVLRRAANEKSALLERAAREPLANLRGWLRKHWCDQFGKTMAANLALAHGQPPPLDLTFSSEEGAAAWAAKHGGETLLAGSVRIRPTVAVSEMPAFKEGGWWVQDLAASLPIKALGDIKGLNVVDLCAAPGGKTLQLAAAGAGVTAVDRSPGRLQRLRDNLDRNTLTTEIVEADALTWQPEREFDLVVLDAPCSASGTMRRHPELPWIRKNFDLENLGAAQDRLLAAAWKLVRPGGRLLYAVCSLEPHECSDRAEAFLAANPNAKRHQLNRPELPNGEDVMTDMGELRTWPTSCLDSGGMDGFFAACFAKDSA